MKDLKAAAATINHFRDLAMKGKAMAPATCEQVQALSWLPHLFRKSPKIYKLAVPINPASETDDAWVAQGTSPDEQLTTIVLLSQ